METIPTPRTTAEEYRAGMSFVRVVDASFACQLEHELTIAKHALEAIANNNHSTWAESVSTAEDALVDINQLSA